MQVHLCCRAEPHPALLCGYVPLMRVRFHSHMPGLHLGAAMEGLEGTSTKSVLPEP